MKEFTTCHNGEYYILEKIQNRDDYELYVADCFWVLVIDGYHEFYYNPKMPIGKVLSSSLPSSVKNYISSFCINARTLGKGQIQGVTPARKDIRWYENNMRIGNMYYSMGQWYVTNRGTFVADDPYSYNCSEVSLSRITYGVVYDMMRMAVQTRTPNYIHTVFDLECFRGINPATIEVRPVIDIKWNADFWVRKYDECVKYKDFGEIKKMRAEVFQDTIQQVKAGRYTSCNGQLVTLPDAKELTANTWFYDREITPVTTAPRYEHTDIEVLEQDCLLAALAMMREEHLRPAVLNMASRRNPGGGVLNGAGAQEENIFRRSNLFKSLYQYASFANQYGLTKSQKQYPLDQNWGGVYSQGACVLRDTEAKGYALLDEPYLLDFISVAAINNPELDSNNRIVPELVDATKRKIRTILRIAMVHGNDSLVLSAFGCGAFHNPPAHMAEIFKEVFDEPEFQGAFRKIVFAIINDHNAHGTLNPEGNFIPFQRAFADTSRQK